MLGCIYLLQEMSWCYKRSWNQKELYKAKIKLETIYAITAVDDETQTYYKDIFSEWGLDARFLDDMVEFIGEKPHLERLTEISLSFLSDFKKTCELLEGR